MTKNSIFGAVLVASCACALACSERRTFAGDDRGDNAERGDDGEGEGEGEGDGAEHSEPTPPGDLPGTHGDGDGEAEACAAHELLCDGVCVDPRIDNQHCGACGRTCDFKLDPMLEGGCYLGECTPLYSPCFAATAEPTTCADVCAASGESCVDGEGPHGCWAVAIGWAADDVESCEMHDPGVGLGVVGCNDPLPFQEKLCGSEHAPCTHFACCCSYTPEGG